MSCMENTNNSDTNDKVILLVVFKVFMILGFCSFKSKKLYLYPLHKSLWKMTNQISL